MIEHELTEISKTLKKILEELRLQSDASRIVRAQPAVKPQFLNQLARVDPPKVIPL